VDVAENGCPGAGRFHPIGRFYQWWLADFECWQDIPTIVANGVDNGANGPIMEP
jgi:hypothetical protein